HPTSPLFPYTTLFRSYRFVQMLAFFKQRGVFSKERHAHVNAIQPYLMRIRLLVPEGAFTGARVLLQLFVQQVCCFTVFFFTGVLDRKSTRLNSSHVKI